MRRLFAFSMLLAGLWMTHRAPTPSLRQPPNTDASGNTCTFGEPDYAASCANVNGNRGVLGRADDGVYGYRYTGQFGYLGGDFGAYGKNYTGHDGLLGGYTIGVGGWNANNNRGFLGHGDYGAFGIHHNTSNAGHLGSEDYGAYGEFGVLGPFGYLGSENYGAYGRHGDSGPAGYLGGSSYGALGIHTTGPVGILGASTFAVWGFNDNGSQGYLGHNNHGAFGQHPDGHYGSLGGYFYGVRGQNANANRAYLGHDDFGLWATGSPWAGYFAGNVHVTGTLSGGSAASKVDHPLDPEGKYLWQRFVESPEMKTVYDGTVVLDARGEAVVALPSYVEALNGDFRYQLTCIGGFAPVYIAEKIQGNRFKIAGGTAGMEVSWLVTGIRHDAWAEANRLVVEQAKPSEERGRYLHPRLYGQPEALRIGLVDEDQASLDHEAMQQQIEEERRQIDAERQRLDEERRRMDEEHERMQQERPQHPTPRDNQP